MLKLLKYSPNLYTGGVTMKTFNEATQIILQAIKDEIKPEVADEDVPVFSAAFCKIYHPLWKYPERQKAMENLFSYEKFPQTEIACQYSDAVLYHGATRVEPNIEYYWIGRAAKYWNGDNTWEDAINSLKEELKQENILN